MKKNMLLIMFLLVFSSMALAVDNPVLKTTLLRYEPVPAEPGDYITIYVQIENIGNANANKVSIRFKEAYPFSIDDAAQVEKQIGALGTSQIYVVDFKVRVDNRAVSGSNDIKFEVTEDYTKNIFTEKIFNVNIQSRDTDLNIEKVIIPQLNPGEKGEISITLKNNADTSINGISFRVGLVNLQGIDLPFAIEGGVSEKNIDILDRKQEATLTYNLISYPTITPGIYKLPVTLDYFDNTGKAYSKIDVLTIIVNPESKIDISVESTTLLKESLVGEVSIKIVNRGFGDIQFTNLKLGNSDSYTLLTSYDEQYLGNIDSDDYESADFKVKANSDKITIPVTLEFKDSLNNAHIIEKELSVNLYSATELGQAKKSSTGTLLIIIIIIAGAVWFFKFRKNSKRK